MIQIIGLMLAAYIFTRMAEKIGDDRVNPIARLLAVATLLVAGFGAILLFALGTSTMRGLSGLPAY